jgi:hypothetical protein
MTPRLVPVAFVDLTVPKATERKSAMEDKAIEHKGKGKAEEGQNTYEESGSSGWGGGRGESKCRHGQAPGQVQSKQTEGGATARTAGAPPSAIITE